MSAKCGFGPDQFCRWPAPPAGPESAPQGSRCSFGFSSVSSPSSSPDDCATHPARGPGHFRREGTGSLRNVSEESRSISLIGWSGPWDPDDPDANFKADVALYSHVDPMATIGRLASAMDIPEGAVVHYVLAKWASAGSGGLLELGPSMVHRLWAPLERAETIDTDVARLEAYEQLRQMISWLRLPLVGDGSDSGY
jgi:Family of unknown function (DUF6027)